MCPKQHVKKIMFPLGGIYSMGFLSLSVLCLSIYYFLSHFVSINSTVSINWKTIFFSVDVKTTLEEESFWFSDSDMWDKKIFWYSYFHQVFCQSNDNESYFLLQLKYALHCNHFTPSGTYDSLPWVWNTWGCLWSLPTKSLLKLYQAVNQYFPEYENQLACYGNSYAVGIVPLLNS